MLTQHIKVYVIQHQRYSPHIYSIYSTLEKAKAAFPDETWHVGSTGNNNWYNNKDFDRWLCIEEWELDNDNNN